MHLESKYSKLEQTLGSLYYFRFHIMNSADLKLWFLPSKYVATPSPKPLTLRRYKKQMLNTSAA